MEKFKYGPLVFISAGMDDDEGNYYWNGQPPVGYDPDGIPVDSKGMQCLDISCPIHPSHEPTETVYSSVLESDIPTISSFRVWFSDNFLEVSDDQIKRWIIRRWSKYTRSANSELYFSILQRYSSVEEIMEAVWPDEQQS